MTIRRTVKRVLDGDTFTIARSLWGSRRIRIAGVNAPEKWQFGGREATDKLKRMIQNKTVTLQPVGKSYGRTIARVRFKRSLIR